MRTIKCYRFVTDDLKSQHGRVQWVIGEWQKRKGKLILCGRGFHASQRPLDSLNYVFGTRWFECEARGNILKDADKFCASEMRLVREIPYRVIQEFAINCAWRVLHIFEKEYPKDKRPRQALEAAKTYLKFPTEENLQKLNAAWDAARDAAWDAARDAARAAAWDAAWAAASAAARAAARDAAWAAARAAEIKWQNRHLLNLIRKAKRNNMSYKNYQEIVNTTDCNAEVNFVGADGELKIMGWAKKLIDTVWEARQKEIDEAEQRGVKKVVDWMKLHKAYLCFDESDPAEIKNLNKAWQAFLKKCEPSLGVHLIKKAVLTPEEIQETLKEV